MLAVVVVVVLTAVVTVVLYYVAVVALLAVAVLVLAASLAPATRTSLGMHLIGVGGQPAPPQNRGFSAKHRS